MKTGMKALFYLTKRSLINHLKKAVSKPTRLIALIFGTLYAVFVAVMLGGVVLALRMDSVRGLVILVTVWSIYVTLSNLYAYSTRKGIIFRQAHAHFVFPAPISPKLILLNSAWMNYLVSAGVYLILTIAALTVFQVEPWRAFLFFLAGCAVELALEISVMIFLYTNDRLPEKLIKGICMAIKIFLVGITVLVILYFKKNGVSIESAFAFIDWRALQMIPVIGWQISAYRFILLGPTALNTVGTALYILSAALAVVFVCRMKCEGGYYEEAAKFADDYAEMRKRQKDGEMVMGFGKKKRKLRKVADRIQATGARAVFYRQLLEYKKEKYFIFSKMTVVCAGIAFIFTYALGDTMRESGVPGEIFLLGIVAYVSLVMTGYMGKWDSELKNPYLFLIPDSPFKKLWYATAMEHVKAFVDGCIICIPIGIFYRVHFVYVIFCILIYTVIQANKLYTKVIAQILLGNVFGKTGQEIFRAFIQMTILGAGAGVALLVGIFVNLDFIFPILLVYSIIVTVGTGCLASIRFDIMEQIV